MRELPGWISELMPDIRWLSRSFDDLSTRELYQLMKLRVDVFVVEQRCVYAELDDMDTQPSTLHLLGTTDEQIIAYARLIGPGARWPDGRSAGIRIGRVVIKEAYRGQGIARLMMQQLLEYAGECWPGQPVALSAQSAVTAFYHSLGFRSVSKEYLEDGIPHIDMRRGEAGDT